MIETNCNIETAEGLMPCFIACPAPGAAFPVVLFYMDSHGIREELREMARRIAVAGYYVLLPDLYYRRNAARDKAQAVDRAAEVLHQPPPLTVRAVMADTAAMLAYLDSQPEADATRLGAVGYCMSGAFVLAAAGTFPDRFKCAASIHGVDLLTQGADSPHLLANRVRGELYFASAEFDDYMPAAVMTELDSHLRESGAHYRVEIYPGTRHGFAFADREDAYDRESAERHWARLFALFQRNLHAADA